MAKVACYTPDGVEKMKEPVDARECVAQCGFTMEPPEVKASEPKAPAGKPVALMNKAELIALAESMEIELEGDETNNQLKDKISAASTEE